MIYIIEFLKSTSQEHIDEYLISNSCLVESTLESLDGIVIVSCASTPPITDIVKSVTEDKSTGVRLLGDSFTIDTNSDADWWKLVSAKAPDLDAETLSYRRLGNNSTVYVVDSGIDHTHEEFTDTVITHLFSINESFEDNRGHGTAVASLISGKNCGITNAQLVSVKIFEAGQPTLLSDLLNAFNSILSHYLPNNTKAGIVNISWGIDKNMLVESAIQLLIDAGMIVVVSAGNNGIPIADVTPASMEDAFVVGAYTEDFVPADFSNYTGSLKIATDSVNYGELDGWAPGTNIRVALITGGLGLSNGTSLSCAIASAAIAYNIGTYAIDDDGSIPLAIDRTRYFGSRSLSKRGILSLGDKYAGSINRIITLMTDDEHIDFSGTSSIITLKNIIRRNTDIAIPILTKDLVTDYTVDMSAMPPGVQIVNGWVVGKHDIDSMQMYRIPVSYTILSGEIIDSVFVLVTAPEEGIMTLDELDQEIRIELAQLCGPVGLPCTVGGKIFTCYYCQGACGTSGGGGDGSCRNACGSDGAKDYRFDFFCSCLPGQECR